MDRNRELGRFIGIDYSMSCPAIVILDKSGTFANSQVFYMTDTKKYAGQFENIIGESQVSYKSEMERFNNITEWVVRKSNLTEHDIVCIEDYSMGSKGRVFHIAENCGIMKHKLYLLGIRFETVPPTVIKKFATGKGNSDKDAMYKSFIMKGNADLMKVFDSKSKKISSPIGDIVDAYFIAKYAEFTHA